MPGTSPPCRKIRPLLFGAVAWVQDIPGIRYVCAGVASVIADLPDFCRDVP